MMSLEAKLRAERVDHLDLTGFCEVSSDTILRDVLSKMQAQEQSVCLITEGGALVGIFTERDVLRHVMAAPETWDQPVKEYMTPNPVAAGMGTPAADALWLMDEHHVRNLPILDERGTIIGNMTYHAVIAYLAGLYPVEVLNRPLHPERFPRKAEGG